MGTLNFKYLLIVNKVKIVPVVMHIKVHFLFVCFLWSAPYRSFRRFHGYDGGSLCRQLTARQRFGTELECGRNS